MTLFFRIRGIRFLIALSAILAFLAFAIFPVNAYACRETPVTINEVPLPRSYQTTVPWAQLQGLWESEEFVFEFGSVIRRGSSRYISVKMRDPKTREVIRQGGIAIRTNGSRASGILTGVPPAENQRGDDTFVIFRGFSEKDAQGRPMSRNFFVVTIRTLKEKVRVCRETHHELVRQN